MTERIPAGSIRPWKMQPMREVNRTLRRARLLAARQYAPGTIPRKGIIGGYWDIGE